MGATSQDLSILSKFKTKPYDHQLECLNLHGRKKAFALLAEMGTGKTWIIINNIADLWASGELDAVIVFAPNGVHTNWTLIELEKHMPDWVRYRAAAWSANPNKKEKQQLEDLYGSTDSTELRIFTMNWEGLQHKRSFEAAERFCNTSRRLMIVGDEIDAAKNPKADRTKNLMKLKKYSHYRRGMTGTPVDGSPFSLFAPFTFLDENILGTTSYYAFKAEYAEMLDSNNGLVKHIVENKIKMSVANKALITQYEMAIYASVIKNGREELIDIATNLQMATDAQDYEKVLRFHNELRQAFNPAPSAGKTMVLQTMAKSEEIIATHNRKIAYMANSERLPQIVAKGENGRPKYRNLDKLSRLIAPHSYRVLKKDCLDLPDKIYKTVIFDMTTKQKEIYDKAKEECRLVFEGNETPFNKLASLTKLSQITSGYYIHPLSEEPVRIEGDNNKLDLLVDRVQAILDQGKKVIIWARYTIEIEDIVARLKAIENCVPVQYYGAVKKGDRIAAIEAFERGEANVFVGNQQAGGTGITLVAASYVIYFSNNFSMRDRLQSEDRAHRIGQTENVTYINIAAKGTIDEYVIRALSNKKDVADEIVDIGMAMFGTPSLN